MISKRSLGRLHPLDYQALEIHSDRPLALSGLDLLYIKVFGPKVTLKGTNTFKSSFFNVKSAELEKGSCLELGAEHVHRMAWPLVDLDKKKRGIREDMNLDHVLYGTCWTNHGTLLFKGEHPKVFIEQFVNHGMWSHPGVPISFSTPSQIQNYGTFEVGILSVLGSHLFCNHSMGKIKGGTLQGNVDAFHNDQKASVAVEHLLFPKSDVLNHGSISSFEEKDFELKAGRFENHGSLEVERLKGHVEFLQNGPHGTITVKKAHDALPQEGQEQPQDPDRDLLTVGGRFVNEGEAKLYDLSCAGDIKNSHHLILHRVSDFHLFENDGLLVGFYVDSVDAQKAGDLFLGTGGLFKNRKDVLATTYRCKTPILAE